MGRKRLSRCSRPVRQVALGRVRFPFGEDVTDSGQEHLANGNDCFLVASVSFNPAVAFFAFRVFIRFDHGIGNLYEQRLQAGPRTGNTGGLDFSMVL